MEMPFTKALILTTQQIQEGKASAISTIKAEFMKRYEEWLKDLADLDDHDFGWKYGWQRSERTRSLKDNLTAVGVFQQYFYPTRTYERIEKDIGIPRQIIWAIARDGWISEITRDRKALYFVSQKRAKEIWREAKGK